MKLLNIPQEEDDSAIDLTPMLDVVFIMLIFFIVTASFLKESGFDIHKPAAVKQETSNEPGKSISIRIMGDGQIFIGPRRVDIRAVRANIERLRAEQPDAPVIVQAHADARNELLVKSLDAARLAGATQLSVAPLAQ
ncbi:biopolymer transporter ExbD [Sinimarinibacterium sp. NLF-5-8]|uniref:ExbD/TolR family protein n=1 Tax=Sinimarinibacterium sp. NLF-5-8 TaxID=2698684 RepID=UPI00137BC470|nr:biopolymer transporter ExbD [Sinimarinibacterium sp. NLF-5-8]QHS10287.1 biopolymer transporter ExbD [Sinimarinibacterium sp. NLF-5-8]